MRILALLNMPEITLTTFLIVCPLVFLGGFVDAVAGGGGLISLPAYMIAGLPVHNSIATNKLSSGMDTTVSTIRFARGGNIPWKKALPCVIMAMIGSAAGARLALLVDAELFKRLMLVIIPIAAYIDDLRLVKNIYNEFLIYYTKLNSIELDENKMFAIIAYKNIFPTSTLKGGRDYVQTEI